MATRQNRRKSKVTRAESLRAFFGSRPDYRWAAGQRIAESALAIAPDDVLIRRIATFVGANHASPEAEATADPELAAVVAMQRDASLSRRLKILVLGDVEPAEISTLTQGPLPRLKHWEDSFFDVRARRSAIGWVVHYVIGPEMDAGNRQLADRLGLAASGGSQIAIMQVREELGTAPEHSDRIQLLEMRLDLKLRAALRLPIGTPSQAAKFMEQVLAFQKHRQELELEKQRLANQERAAQRHHEEAMIRWRVELAKVSKQVEDVCQGGQARPQAGREAPSPGAKCA